MLYIKCIAPWLSAPSNRLMGFYMVEDEGPKNENPEMAYDEMPQELSVQVRLAKIETRLDHIDGTISELKIDGREHRHAADRDFRILFGALIVATFGLAGLMAKGFHWL